jgi:hypothetical protein
MYSRWYTTSVVLLWLASMTWLVATKVVPTLVVGDPPDSKAVLEAKRADTTVGWEVSFNREVLGWGLSTSRPTVDGGAVTEGWVRFDRVPIVELTPPWLRNMFNWGDKTPLSLSMTSHTTIEIGATGHLRQFNSVLRFMPFNQRLEVRGKLDGSRLAVRVDTGQLQYKTETYLPAQVLPADALSPHTQLPGLRLGQTWRVPVFSPLRPPNAPMEIVQATVVERDSMAWQGRTQEVLIVEYKADSGLSQLVGTQPSGRVWVCADGTVLKQELVFLESTITFVRMPADKANALYEQVRARQRSRYDRGDASGGSLP